MIKLIEIVLFCSFFLSFNPSYAQSRNLERRSTPEEKFVKALKAEWTQSEESEVFLKLFTERKWKEAFFHWDRSFASTPFVLSPTGKALYAYLLFKNGIRIIGLETLFKIATPVQILEELKLLWHAAVPYRHGIWRFVDLEWDTGWTQIFDARAEMVFLLSKAPSFEEIESMDIQFGLKSLNPPLELQWQMVLVLAVNGQLVEATRQLQSLMRVKRLPVSRSLLNLTAARIFFQLGSVNQALSYYKKIPKSSDYWLTAQEEIAWTHILNDEPQKALGYTHTLMHPVLANQVGPEPSYLHALASVKVCDYEEALKTVRTFKAKFETRIKSLLFLQRTGRTKSILHLMQLFSQTKKMPLSLTRLGWRAKYLPTFIYRDRLLFRWQKKRRYLIREARRIKRLSLSISQRESSSSKQEMNYSQAFFKQLEDTIQGKLARQDQRFTQRVEELAGYDLKDIHQTIKKLQIVEAEVLQFVTEKFTSQKIQKAYLERRKEPQSYLEAIKDIYRGQSHQLVFKDKPRELWFDELGNYRVHTKGCADESVKDGEI